MDPIEAVIFWITVVIYALAAGGYVYALVFRNERVLGKLLVLLGIGVLLHAAAIAARYAAQGRLPWAGDYENGLMGGFFIASLTLALSWKRRQLQVIAVATLPLVVLMMGFGAMRNPTLSPMAASLKSFWLYIHVYFAWIAYSAFTMALGTGVLYLLKERDGLRALRNPLYERFPSLERLDELTFRYIVFGFITAAVMNASGAIWAKDLWGSYWSWDPVETWSLISWLFYGMIIHLRITFGWRGRRMAWLAIGAIVFVVTSFFGVTFVVESGLHMFNVR